MPTISGPKISMPDVDLNLKGPKIKGDMDVSVPKIEGDIKAPKVDIEGPDFEVEGTGGGGIKMPKIKMPSFGLKGPKVEGPDIDVNLPKADIDVRGPKIDIQCPDIDVEGPEGKIKGPKFKMPTISGPNISMPDMDFNLKGPKIKGDVDMSVPKIEGDIEGPNIKMEGAEGFKIPKIKVPSFGIKGPVVEGAEAELNVPKVEVDIKRPVVDIKDPKIGKGHNIDSSFEGPDVDVNLKGKKGKVKMPKVKGKMKTDNIDSKTGNVELSADSPDLHLKGPKVKKPFFGKLHFPDVEFDIKSPKVKGGGSVSGNSKSVEFDSSPGSLKADIPGVDIQSPVVSLEGPDVKVKKSKIKMPKLISGSKVKSADVDINVPKLQSPEMSMNLGASDASLEGQGIKVKGRLMDPELKGTFEGRVKGHTDAEDFKAEGFQGAELKMPSAKLKVPHISSSDEKTGEIGMHTDVAVSSAIEYTEGNVTFPKIKVPKFGIALPQVEGREMGVDVGSGELTASGNVSSSLEVPCPDLKSSGEKVKVKKPRFFGKSKAKGGSAADLTFQGPEVEGTIEGGSKVSKELSASSGELIGGKMVEGSSGLKISPKSKSASLDLYKKSRHRSSSLSDEGELASPTSVEGHLQTEGGNMSVDVGGAKVKGKKGMLKFGTFGGFGAKSKGSYEVTLGEESEPRIEGAGGVVSPSKKSRVSSSSSSDSVSKGGFRFPRVELAVSPKK
ncbi:hypothetical protein PGIGA_G00235970 [Pangasianodon gigas]|uniref:Uncharacterized protein n=1 Tax=Pangasianodon gigas TaxID=30993 RepID=A0ACC5WMI8_PANGG|nr:hypothetical protein [Pangasianodon gigas]